MTGGAAPSGAVPEPSERREAIAQYAGVLFFSVSLGITLVAFPLFVVGEGGSKTVAGVLIGLSAAVQVLTRWQLGSLMRVVSNANVISAAAVLKCLAVGLLVLSPSMTALVASAALQGMARAFFWTGNQVQIVRSPRPTPKAIATLNMTATVGMLIGPPLGGFIAERSFEAAFAVAAAVALVSIVPTLMLHRPPPFARVGGHSYLHLLRNPGVRVGVWASIAVGAWRGLLGSYVPIGLDAAGSTETVIGVVIAVANGAAAVSGYFAVNVEGSRVAPGVARWGAVTLLSTVLVGFDLPLWLIMGALVVGGVANGLIQVLAITAISDAVQPELTGDAVTLVGVARGMTLSGAPLGVAALLVLGLGPAVLVVTTALVGSAVVFSDRRGWHRQQ